MLHEGAPKTTRDKPLNDDPYSDAAIEASRRKVDVMDRVSGADNETESPEPKQDFGERATALLESRRAHAENAAILGDDEELADTLHAFLQTKFKMEGRTWEGGHLSDEEREDSETELARKKTVIESLTLQPDGSLSREGKEAVDNFRGMTKEVVAEVLAGDTAGLSEDDIAKYRKLGENLVDETQAAQPEDQPETAEAPAETLSPEQRRTKQAIDEILEAEEK